MPLLGPTGLPPEVRAMIYQLVLVQPLQPVLMVKKLGSFARKRRRNTKTPLCSKQHPDIVSSKSILAVCHTFYREARQIYYNHNHLLCHTSKGRLERFLRSLGSPCRQQILKLTIVVPIAARNCFTAPLCTLLSDCIRLAYLRLHYEGLKAAYALGGITRLLQLHGMTSVSVTRRRSTASNDEQSQHDAAAPYRRACPSVEMQELIAHQLRAAWLTPRTVCWKCNGKGFEC